MRRPNQEMGYMGLILAMVGFTETINSDFLGFHLEPNLIFLTFIASLTLTCLSVIIPIWDSDEAEEEHDEEEEDTGDCGGFGQQLFSGGSEDVSSAPVLRLV